VSYQPHLLLMSDVHRRIASAALQFDRYKLFLRPTRRHIFVRNFKLADGKYVPEFFRACFGVLAYKNDPEKKPALVIEAEPSAAPLSAEIAELYNHHGILWASIVQDGNCFRLECSHGGTELSIVDSSGNFLKLLASALSWHERRITFSQGSLVHSHTERTLREAVEKLSPTYRIDCQHQVPVSHVLGHRSGLSPEETKLLGSEIDAVITMGFDADPDCGIVLPVKLDVHETHRTNAAVAAKDDAVRRLFARFDVPLLTVVPDGVGYQFDCPALELEPINADQRGADDWADALAPFLGAAIRYSGRSF
jgi:hypothetical protein